MTVLFYILNKYHNQIPDKNDENQSKMYNFCKKCENFVYIVPKITKVIDISNTMRYTVIVEDNKHKDNDVVCKYGHCLFLFFKGDV